MIPTIAERFSSDRSDRMETSLNITSISRLRHVDIILVSANSETFYYSTSPTLPLLEGRFRCFRAFTP